MKSIFEHGFIILAQAIILTSGIALIFSMAYFAVCEVEQSIEKRKLIADKIKYEIEASSLIEGGMTQTYLTDKYEIDKSGCVKFYDLMNDEDRLICGNFEISGMR